MRPPTLSTLFPYTTLFRSRVQFRARRLRPQHVPSPVRVHGRGYVRSEEHTSELQSRGHLVCRLLREKKNDQTSQEYFRRPSSRRNHVAHKLLAQDDSHVAD